MIEEPYTHESNFRTSLVTMLRESARTKQGVAILLKTGGLYELTGVPSVGDDAIRFQDKSHPGTTRIVPFDNIAEVIGHVKAYQM